MNIVLIDPPSMEGTTIEGFSSKMPTPNLGPIYIATYLKIKSDANVIVIDMAANDIDFADMASLIKNYQPSLVGISAKTFNILSAYKLSGIIKDIAPKTIVVVGGAHPTALPEYTLKECQEIDAIVMREGEHSVFEIYQRIRNGYETSADVFSGVLGVVFRNQDGEIVHNEERNLIEDLDSLPLPDLTLVDYRKYQRLYNPSRNRFEHIYPVFASRGCPFNCTFCMPLHKRKHRVRSINRIIDEIELLNEKHGAEWIYFEDSLFCSRRDWFMEFCEKYTERGLHKKVQWGFETRVDTARDDLFELAKKSGCIYTFFGVESGSESVLRKANKKYTRKMILEKIAAAKRAGIDSVNISIILGLPHETRETISETLTLIKEAHCDSANINILDIYPGTVVFDMVDKGEAGLRWIEGKRMNWAAYSREEPMVEVNDLTAEALLSFKREAIRISRSKDRKLNLSRKLRTFIELARTDRRTLYKMLKDMIVE